jgi:uncharacterized protein (DUF305 family)
MTSHRSLIRRTTLLAASTAAALVLAGCGGGDDDGMSAMDPGATSTGASSSAAAHNASDVGFAGQMISHHRQAVEMAALASTRGSGSDVKALAEKIKGAQDPEITIMSGWLTAWGEKVPVEMEGMDHMSSPMPGMMASKDVAKLENASGAEFDTMFLEMMVTHHQGAVLMARTEKSKGTYRPAKELADSVITAQSAEIQQMNEMLGKN